ncbi:bifunctional adenosylcobinamide kinase/adenosylcobinamide-phosphate guanylyltransferase [Vagococcus fessus]|uniref:Adenosylcobinamide kinase n=1 Tax=Vagococcus fessus TaxID=120370 RepID=A0A430ACZ2_9ENTE|nr:bifunctional adenosylcobinamide kinase/adenosylcobinamide-phosphate guanylyltransferase [Vagococcus fessus]RSU05086.1 bifunctional adenosylcobinamide kinase/adenosylcobinamide-phosphate guanylyltransferase [Vagococcus fessus]
MNKLILVTGGARSGKSSFAEGCLKESEKVTYIATGISSPDDKEMQSRIKHHQESRPQHWETKEGYIDLSLYFNEVKNVEQDYLFDCATLFTTNYFFYLIGKIYQIEPPFYDEFIESMSMDDYHYIEREILIEWKKIIAQLRVCSGENCYIVTNEIGLGLVPQNKFSRLFRDILGRVNQFLAQEADDVYFVISGIPQKIK